VKNVSDTDTGLARREDELAARTAELERVEAKLREAQEALEATRELHRQILSAETDAIITFDAQTLRLRDANEKRRSGRAPRRSCAVTTGNGTARSSPPRSPRPPSPWPAAR